MMTKHEKKCCLVCHSNNLYFNLVQWNLGENLFYGYMYVILQFVIFHDN